VRERDEQRGGAERADAGLIEELWEDAADDVGERAFVGARVC
jgi:hypothetical protein